MGPASRLRRRNVELFDSDGIVIAGFWQYGTLPWDKFYKYLAPFVVVSTDWSIFQYEPGQQQCGAPCLPGAEIVQPGQYVLLSTVGEPTRVGLEPIHELIRHHALDLPRRLSSSHEYRDYDNRARARDGECLITGIQSDTRLEVAHIFPRVHGDEWARKGYSSKITDRADKASMGGSLKIDSVQNLITLRADLCAAWNGNEFGVDPNDNYRITSFINGNADFNNLHLRLDHIQDPTLRPLNDLFIEHFKQGLFKYMIGSGYRGWSCSECEDAFCAFDLSDAKVWGTKEGKQQLEVALAERLFDHQLSQSIQDDVPRTVSQFLVSLFRIGHPCYFVDNIR